MTGTPHSTKIVAAAHVSGLRDDDVDARAKKFIADLPEELGAQMQRHCDRDPRRKEVLANLLDISDLCWDGEAYRAECQSRAPRKPPSPPPDALRTPAEAARKLRCSIKTLNGYVASGALRYVIIGHGKKRPRKMFTDADLNEFIANQTRKDSSWLPSRTRVRRSGALTSGSEVIAFTARRNARTSGTRKK